ncbi:MAG: type 4a pilus biogenesis protein PilO [Candidatus Omnitrophica bacterium]|nr:type 4a pilus biogenesis protein PilO [Candidatus Omnitrophota bacterium]
MSFLSWVREGLDRRQVIATTLVALFAILFAAVMFYRPMAQSWQAKRGAVEAAELKLARYERLVSQKSSLLEELAQYKERYARNRSHDEEVSAFLKQLEEMIAASGLKVNDLRPIPYEERPILDTLVIELTAEGEMDQLIGFLHIIASAPDLLDVRNMSVQRRTTGEGHLGITAEATKTLFIGK